MTINTLPETLQAPVTRAQKMLIGNDWVEAESGETIPVFDPSTGQTLSHQAAGGKAEVDRAVKAARAAFPSWSKITPRQRERLLTKLADLLEQNAEQLAQLESLDVGMPFMEAAYIDVPFSLDILRYYAGWPTKITGDTIPVSFPQTLGGGPFHAYTLRELLGVVAAIIPWNLPLMMAIKKLAPALATGNTIVIKPAEQTPLVMARLAELVLEAGIPEGVVNYVTGLGETAGAALVEHPGVNKVTFTGSVETGKAIARAATGTLKRVSLELGGKSPNIIFGDADLNSAIVASGMAIFAGAGESCIAGSRLYAHRDVYEDVLAALADRANSIKVGPGMAEGTEMGPLISAEHRDKVLSYVDLAKEDGRIVAGGTTEGDGGYFVRPTVLADLHENSRVLSEEIFGPVLSVIPFDSEEEVLAKANNTQYGLGAAVWTKDIGRAHRMAASIESGQVWVNCYQPVDAALPFGGSKQSGYGRETCRENLDEYLESKTVVVQL